MTLGLVAPSTLVLGTLVLGSLAGCGGGDDSSKDPKDVPSADPKGDPSGETNEGPSAFLPLYESGSRLRAVTIGEPGSSARLFVTWYDTELETECRFGTAEDGEQRCLPRGQELAPGFADDACTESIFYDALVEPCATHPPYRVEALGEGTCGARVIRMQQETLDSVYHESCSEEPTVLEEGATVWSDAETVEPETFVAGTVHQRLNSTGIGVVEVRGEDGSRQVTHIAEETYERCYPQEVAEGGRRCVPNTASLSEWWYTDEGCSGDVLAFSPRSTCGDGPQLEFALDYGAGPDVDPTVVRLGSPYEGSLYEQSPGSDACEAREAEEQVWEFYLVEEPADVEEFRVVSQEGRGDTRIQTHHNVIDGVTLTYVSGRGLFDSELETACVPRRTSAGGRVCMPEEARVVREWDFSDDACSEVVAYSPTGDLRFVARHERDSCAPDEFSNVLFETYEAVESYAGPVYRKTPEGDCEIYSEEAEEGYSTVRPVDFAELEEIREEPEE